MQSNTPILEKYFTNPDNIGFVSDKIDPNELCEMGETELEYISVMYKHIECKDGYKISVQANYGAYCNPRITFFRKHTFIYNEMELGFPNREDELINEYAESNDYTQTVYPYVPVEIIEKLLEKHGGIKEQNDAT